jgi:PAS domain S-box-containing protein
MILLMETPQNASVNARVLDVMSNKVFPLLALIMGWPVLLRVHSHEQGLFFFGWSGMQVNTAIGLLLAGLAIFIKGKSKSTSLLLNLFVTLLGLLTTIEHLFDLDFRIDQLLIFGSKVVYVDHPGRMAFIAALSFFLYGLSQVLSSRARFEKDQCTLPAFMGALTFGLGLSMFICYLIELDPNSQISSFVQMAPASALGITFLGAASVGRCIFSLSKNKSTAYQILPLLTFTVLTLLSLLSWQISLGLEKRVLLERVSEQVKGKTEKVEEKLFQTIGALRRYADRIKVLGLSNEEFLKVDSKNYLDQLTIISRLGITDQNLKVIWSYPYELHHQVLGFDQSSQPARKRAFELAGVSNATTLSESITLRSGGTGALLVVPPLSRDRKKFFLYATVNYKKLLDGVFDAKSFSIEVKENGTLIYAQNARTSHSMSDTLTASLTIGSSQLKFYITPTQAYLNANLGKLPIFILIFVELIAVLLTALSWITAKASFEREEFNRNEVENLERLNIALETSNIAAWSLDLLTGEVWRSPFHDRIFGFKDQQASWGQDVFFSLIHPDDLERVKAQQIETVKIKGPAELVFRIKSAQSQEVRWLKLVTRTSRDEAGTPYRIRGTVRDITSEKKAEFESQLELEWKKAIINGADYSIISTDKSGTIQTFNRRASEMLGYTPAEVIGKLTPLDFHDAEEVSERAALLSSQLGKEIQPGFDVFVAKTVLSGVPDENTWSYISKTGKRFTVRLSISAVKSAEGAVLGFIGIAKDITADLQARKETQITYDRLQRVVDSTGEGIWERKFDSKEMQFLNVQSKRIFGFADDYNPNLDEIYARIPVSEALKIRKQLDAHIADPSKAFDFEFRLDQDGPVGQEKWIRARGKVTFKEGKPDQLVATLSDVTVSVRAREQLELALTEAKVAVVAKSAFLASMSHEIRTPLNGVIGMTDLILDTDLSDDQRSFAQVAQQSGLSLLSLINDVLDFSKMEAGKMDLEDSHYDLVQVVENQIDVVAVKALEKDIAIASFISPDLPKSLTGDSGKIGQILLNLIGNAVKFTERGGVYVDVRKTAQGMLRFEIRDQGIGISAEGIKKLFQPFSQADSSVSNKFGGTGLGLSICKRLVEAMDGRIGVESEAGVGSNFWFELPLIADEQSPQVMGPPTLKRILILEDDVNIQASLQNYIHHFGIDVEAGSSLLEASMSVGKSFDLVFVSSRIIQRSEPEHVVNMLKRFRDKNVRVVGLSDFVMRDHSLFLNLGLSVILKKPIKRSQLFKVLLEAPNESVTEKPQSSETRIQASTREARGKKNILVAEDVQVNQLLIRKMLEKLGYSATIVSNGVEVLEALSSETFDFVLMDCQMPEMDGFEATTRVRALTDEAARTIPIVALTANALNGDARRCLEVGMNDYMSKPVKMEQLEAMLSKWVDPVS